jgi:hypothetical protein
LSHERYSDTTSSITPREDNIRYVSPIIMAGKAKLNVPVRDLVASVTNNAVYKLGLIPGSNRISHRYVQTGPGTPVATYPKDNSHYCTRVVS